MMNPQPTSHTTAPWSTFAVQERRQSWEVSVLSCDPQAPEELRALLEGARVITGAPSIRERAFEMPMSGSRAFEIRIELEPLNEDELLVLENLLAEHPCWDFRLDPTSSLH